MRRIAEIIQDSGRTFFRLEQYQEEKRFLFIRLKKAGWYPVEVDVFDSTYTMGYEKNKHTVSSYSKTLLKGKISVLDDLETREPYTYRGYTFYPTLKFAHDRHHFSIVYYTNKQHDVLRGQMLFNGMDDIMKYVDKKLHKDHVINTEIL